MLPSKRVSILKEVHGLSVSAFAKRAGLAPSTIKGIISEKTNPRHLTIKAISDAFNMPITFFYEVDIEESVLRYVAKFNMLSSSEQDKYTRLLEGTYSPVELFSRDYSSKSNFPS